MKKFAVFSGFLGSGKTTAMMALTRFYGERFGRAAMISNDLGEGVTLALAQKPIALDWRWQDG